MADEQPTPIRQLKTVSTELEGAWPEEVVQWAYELWAYVYGKSVKLTVDRLNNPKPEDMITTDGRKISHNTVTAWVNRYRWSDRLVQQMKTVAPDLHDQVLGNLMVGSLRMSEYMVRLSNEEVPIETRDQQGKAKILIEAGKVLFDRSGFIPWLSASDKGKPAAPTRSYEEAIGTMSDEELRETMYGNFMKLADKQLKPEDDE